MSNKKAAKIKVSMTVDLAIDPREVMAYIEEFMADKGYPPTQRDLVIHFDVDDWTIHDVLCILQLKWRVYPQPYRVAKASKFLAVRWKPRKKPKQRKYREHLVDKRLRNEDRREKAKGASNGKSDKPLKVNIRDYHGE